MFELHPTIYSRGGGGGGVVSQARPNQPQRGSLSGLACETRGGGGGDPLCA